MKVILGMSRSCSLTLSDTDSKKLDMWVNTGNSSAQSILLNQLKDTDDLGQKSGGISIGWKRI